MTGSNPRVFTLRMETRYSSPPPVKILMNPRDLGEKIRPEL